MTPMLRSANGDATWWQTELTAQGTKIERRRFTCLGNPQIQAFNIAAGGKPVQDVGDPWWPLPWVDKVTAHLWAWRWLNLPTLGATRLHR